MNIPHNAAPRHELRQRPKPPAEAQASPRRTLGITTVVLSVLATVLLFGLVGFQALIVRSQSTIDDLDARVSSATRTNERLRLEVGELESPERVRIIALSLLGMIEPEVVAYLEPISADELAPEVAGQ